MPFKLQINFSGLCAFVPKFLDPANREEASEISVLVLDPPMTTSDQCVDHRHAMPCDHERHDHHEPTPAADTEPSHVPLLWFHVENYKVSSDKLAIKFGLKHGVYPNEDNKYLVGTVQLNYDKLKIDGMEGEKIKVENSFEKYIPSMKNIYNGVRPVEVKDECLEESSKLKDLGIAGRLVLKGVPQIGIPETLGTTIKSSKQCLFFSTEPQKPKDTKTYMFTPGKHEQQIHFFTEFTTTMPGDELKIYFGESDPNKYLTLKSLQEDGSSDKVLRIFISNLASEKDKKSLVAEIEQAINTRQRLKDKHFGHYYKLALWEPESLRIPEMKKRADNEASIRPPMICSSAILESPPDEA